MKIFYVSNPPGIHLFKSKNGNTYFEHMIKQKNPGVLSYKILLCCKGEIYVMKYLGVFLTIITKRSILDVAAVIDPPLGQM